MFLHVILTWKKYPSEIFHHWWLIVLFSGLWAYAIKRMFKNNANDWVLKLGLFLIVAVSMFFVVLSMLIATHKTIANSQVRLFLVWCQILSAWNRFIKLSRLQYSPESFIVRVSIGFHLVYWAKNETARSEVAVRKMSSVLTRLLGYFGIFSVLL